MKLLSLQLVGYTPPGVGSGPNGTWFVYEPGRNQFYKYYQLKHEPLWKPGPPPADVTISKVNKPFLRNCVQHEHFGSGSACVLNADFGGSSCSRLDALTGFALWYNSSGFVGIEFIYSSGENRLHGWRTDICDFQFVSIDGKSGERITSIGVGFSRPSNELSFNGNYNAITIECLTVSSQPSF